MPRIVLIAKSPLVSRIPGEDLARLTAAGAVDAPRLAAAAACHAAALHEVRRVLAGMKVRECPVESVVPGAVIGDADLIVTVGGDGTVLTANSVAGELPVLAVNSDPAGSIGHFTRTDAAGFGALLTAWRAGRSPEDAVPRLRVSCSVSGRVLPLLNDCLFASTNPAAMTRAILVVDGEREAQRSSGLWIATAAGSTAAIRSAGAEPVPESLPALLWRVREPFHGRHPLRLLCGTQTPPRGLAITAAMPGTALWLDGPNICVPLAAGETAAFDAGIAPLRLVTPR